MSGPQGSDPGPWADRSATGADQSAGAAASWQPTGDGAAQQYQQYGQAQPAPGYSSPQPYGTPGYGQTAYGQTAYGQTGYGQAVNYAGTPQYGQFGAPGQYPTAGQPGQFAYGQPAGPVNPKKSGRTIGILLAVLGAVVVAAVLVTGFWKPGFFITTKLDVNKVQEGVQQILSDSTNGYGAKNVKDVKCNNGQNPTVKKGGTFTCEVSVDGTKRQVTVTMQDDKGTYEVGRPK